MSSKDNTTCTCTVYIHVHVHSCDCEGGCCVMCMLQEVSKGEGDERSARLGPAGPRQHCTLLPLVGGASTRGLAASGTVGPSQQN